MVKSIKAMLRHLRKQCSPRKLVHHRRKANTTIVQGSHVNDKQKGAGKSERCGEGNSGRRRTEESDRLLIKEDTVPDI